MSFSQKVRVQNDRGFKLGKRWRNTVSNGSKACPSVTWRCRGLVTGLDLYLKYNSLSQTNNMLFIINKCICSWIQSPKINYSAIIEKWLNKQCVYSDLIYSYSTRPTALSLYSQTAVFTEETVMTMMYFYEDSFYVHPYIFVTDPYRGENVSLWNPFAHVNRQAATKFISIHSQM